MQHSTMKV